MLAQGHGATSPKGPGQCFVTATRAARGTTPSMTSSTAVITFAKSTHNGTVTSVIPFGSTGALLSSRAKSMLDAFAQAIKRGDAVTITSYAHDSSSLAHHRATVVADYLMSRIKVKISARYVTATSLHQVSLRRE